MCIDCGWEDYERDITDALDAGKESDFLESVLGWIIDEEHITEDQKRGVDRWLK